MQHRQLFANQTALIVDDRRGLTTLSGPNGSILRSAARLEVEGATPVNPLVGATVRLAATVVEIRFRCGAISGVLRLRARSGPWLTVSLELTNRSRQAVRVLRFDFLELAHPAQFDFGGAAADLRLFSNPRGMGYFAGTRDLLPGTKPDRYDLGPVRPNGGLPYERWNQSWMLVAVWDKPSRRGVVIGAEQPMHESLLFASEGDAFIGRYFADSRLIAPGRSVRAPRTMINLHDAPREGIEAYAEANRQPLRVRDLATLVGWNSFDYYLNTETLAGIIENADAIRRQPRLREQVRWICVDSGWEYRWGEYHAVEHRFPGGLRRLVKEMARRGFKTGLWTAPLMVERWSTAISRWDPEVLVRDEQGNFLPVFNDNCFLVDPTHPAGERYLRDLYRRLHADGIRYFKCDFLEMGYAHPRARFKRHMSLTDVNRRVLEIIREAIGPESFLLACISTAESAIGICDAMRISGDMHNLWACAQYSALNTAWRWWMHGTLFWNDPDMIPVRGPETADVGGEAYRVEKPYAFLKGDSGSLFTRREAELWMAFCLLSGGLFSLCDRIARLNRAGRRILDTAMGHLSQVAAKPIDFYESGLPALYLQRDGAVTRLGVFNWGDRAATIRVHTDGLIDIPSGTRLHEIWSGQTRTWTGPFAARLPAHSCLYYRFTTPDPKA